MKNTIITIDLAKSVFELAIANQQYRITQRLRLDRQGFTEFMHQQSPTIVVMESCGSAHHWGREFLALGHEVYLLPVQYVRPYRRRNKTDRADCEALLEAYRCDGMKPVTVKSLEQQELQLMHRLREQWKQTRLKRMNFLRGLFREQGIPLPTGEREVILPITDGHREVFYPKHETRCIHESIEEKSPITSQTIRSLQAGDAETGRASRRSAGSQGSGRV